MPRLLRGFLIFSTIQCLCQNTGASAADAPITEDEAFPIQISWAEKTTGAVKHPVQVQQTHWVWPAEDDKLRRGAPFLRVKVQGETPTGWKFLGYEGGVIAASADPQTNTVSFDLAKIKTSTVIRFADLTGVAHAYLVDIAITNSTPFVLSPSPSNNTCSHIGFKLLRRTEARPTDSIKKLNEPVHSLFVSLRCSRMGNHIDVRLHRSDDATWKTATGTSLGTGEPNELRYSLQTTGLYAETWQRAALPAATGLISEIDLVDQSENRAKYELRYMPGQAPIHETTASRLLRGISIGLGLTQYRYIEQVNQISLSGQSLTGKASYNLPLQFINQNVDGSVGGFATLTTLSTSNSEYAPHRYYGLNLRMGYRIPVAVSPVDYRVSGGWYIWGMLRSTSTTARTDYGMATVMGPQLFLSITKRRQAERERGWWSYFKYAAISNGAFAMPDSRNYEVAIGGGYDLFKAVSPNLSATLDLAQTRVEEGLNAMMLKTASVGLQYRF